MRKDAELFGLGAPELIIILLVVLLLFGGTKLPQLARSLGRAQHEFKAGIADGTKDPKEVVVKIEPSDASDKPQSEK